MKLEIVTEKPSVVLRPLQVQDADELFLLVNHNREYLRAWLPWLDEAKTQTDQVKFIQRCSECAAKGTEFHYAILVGGDIAGMVFVPPFREAESVCYDRLLARKVYDRPRYNDSSC
jgi:hypothetical protein